MIRDAILQAERMHRKALEQTYMGVCTIIEYHEVTDEVTKESSEEEVAVVKEQPCSLSFETIAAASQTETAAAITQGVKLFLSPDIRVKSGSKIIVTQDGVTDEYSVSGKPAVYSTHQEIMLELCGRWA